jgi:alanine racemase
MKQTYRCWAEIDRSALRHNAKIVRERVGSAEIVAVVKANAYGHGLIGVAETLADEVQLFGVANLEEALALRAKDRQSPSAVSFPQFLRSKKQKISIG